MSFEYLEPKLYKRYKFKWKGIDMEDNEFTKTDLLDVYSLGENIYIVKADFADEDIVLYIKTNNFNLDVARKNFERYV